MIFIAFTHFYGTNWVSWNKIRSQPGVHVFPTISTSPDSSRMGLLQVDAIDSTGIYLWSSNLLGRHHLPGRRGLHLCCFCAVWDHEPRKIIIFSPRPEIGILHQDENRIRSWYMKYLHAKPSGLLGLVGPSWDVCWQPACGACWTRRRAICWQPTDLMGLVGCLNCL